MSFRRGMATGLTTLLMGTAVVAASSDSCLGNSGYILPYEIYENMYQTIYTYQEFLQRAGTAVILGAVLGLTYSTLNGKRKRNERD